MWVDSKSRMIVLSTSDKSLHLINKKKVWSKPYGIYDIGKVIFYDDYFIVLLLE